MLQQILFRDPRHQFCLEVRCSAMMVPPVSFIGRKARSTRALSQPKARGIVAEFANFLPFGLGTWTEWRRSISAPRTWRLFRRCRRSRGQLWYTRSIMVSPSATSAASTSPRTSTQVRSLHRGSGEFRRPANHRAAAINRNVLLPCVSSHWRGGTGFRKIVFGDHRKCPQACVASAMYCACMSVAKPGYSSVVISEPISFFAA